MRKLIGGMKVSVDEKIEGPEEGEKTAGIVSAAILMVVTGVGSGIAQAGGTLMSVFCSVSDNASHYFSSKYPRQIYFMTFS